MPDLTCTSQEFLDLGQGDSEEHAMLLCNFFNFIDRDQKRQKLDNKEKLGKDGKNYQSYIVYGEAIPEGDCWYVLRRDCVNNFVELWNPMTAECFNFDRTETITKGFFSKQKNVSMNQRGNDP
jgi:coiled-coil and C2 domain-containing protein 2A